MRRFFNTSSAVGAAFLVAIALATTAQFGHAAAVIWDDDSADKQWSTGTNWNPDIAGLLGVGDTVTFDDTGSSATQATVTNILTSSTTIDSLSYALPYVEYANSSIHHTTQLAAGVTLTVDGAFGAGIISGGPNPDGTATNTTTGSVTITGQSAGDGALVINAGSTDIAIGYNDPTWHHGIRNFTFDLRGLGSFTATTTGTFYLANGARDDADLYLADTTNTIRADRIALAGWNSNPTIYLGGDTTLNADSIVLGGGLPGGMSISGQWNSGTPSIVFRSDLTDPSVVIRDEAGTGRANLTIGIGGNMNSDNTGKVDFSGGTVDALLGTVIIGQGYPSMVAGNDGIGTLTFGEGTIDATTITVAYTTSGTRVDNASTGTLNINGPGTLMVDSLIVADQQDTANDVRTTGTVNFNAGTLLATLITGGTTSTSTVRTFNWSGGAIGNKLGSDLLVDASMPLTLKTTADHTFDVEAGQTVTVDAVIRESGAVAGITKTGAGTLVLTAANTYSGGTYVLDGTLGISSDANLGAVPASFSASLVQIDGATLHASSTLDFDYNRGLTVGSSGATFDVDADQTLTILRDATGNDPGMVVTGDIVKEGAGTLIFGDTTWTTGKTLTINGGTVICDSADSDDGSIRGNITVNAGATYDHRTINGVLNSALLTVYSDGYIYLNATDCIGGFAGDGTVTRTSSGGVTMNIDYTGATPVDFSGLITGNISLNFRGTSYSTGTQIFSGDNTYTGTTNVSAGTLLINGTHTGGGLYVVDGTGTLGGSGTIGSEVTVFDGGTLAPGNPPGILTLEDGVTFYGGSFAVELNGTTAGTEYDQLLVTGGDVALGDGVTSLVVTTSGFSPDYYDFFWIINNTSTTDGDTTGYFEGLEEGDLMMVEGRLLHVYYHANYDTGALIGGNDVLLTSVPEPSTVAMLLGLAAFGLLGYHRRRQALTR